MIKNPPLSDNPPLSHLEAKATKLSTPLELVYGIDPTTKSSHVVGPAVGPEVGPLVGAEVDHVGPEVGP